jgi:exosortase E/protease (VPEID-CTERM system)
VAVALACVAWYFRAQIRAFDWTVDPIGLTAGALVGVAWAVLADTGTEGSTLADALSTLPPMLLIIWVVTRLAGTVLLVPLVEEMFFRGYVMTRLDRGGLGMRILAIAVSTALFAALHGRWVAAGLAGRGRARPSRRDARARRRSAACPRPVSGGCLEARARPLAGA